MTSDGACYKEFTAYQFLMCSHMIVTTIIYTDLSRRQKWLYL